MFLWISRSDLVKDDVGESIDWYCVSSAAKDQETMTLIVSSVWFSNSSKPYWELLPFMLVSGASFVDYEKLLFVFESDISSCYVFVVFVVNAFSCSKQAGRLLLTSKVCSVVCLLCSVGRWYQQPFCKFLVGKLLKFLLLQQVQCIGSR